MFTESMVINGDSMQLFKISFNFVTPQLNKYGAVETPLSLQISSGCWLSSLIDLI